MDRGAQWTFRIVVQVAKLIQNMHELGASVTIQGWNSPFLYGGYIEKSDKRSQTAPQKKKKQHVSEVNKLVIQTKKNFPSSYHVYIPILQRNTQNSIMHYAYKLRHPEKNPMVYSFTLDANHPFHENHTSNNCNASASPKINKSLGWEMISNLGIYIPPPLLGLGIGSRITLMWMLDFFLLDVALTLLNTSRLQ